MESVPTLRITRRAADRLRAGHLWIYRTDLDAKQDAAPEPGSLVTVTDSRNIPLGTAIYSSASQIAARLVCGGERRGAELTVTVAWGDTQRTVVHLHGTARTFRFTETPG